MRIHEGNYAYDLEQTKDPLTQVRLNWKFTLYELHPVEHILRSGEAETRELAEKRAKSELAKLTGKKIAA
ncbi:MAG TPA: hypothetical protein VKZ53_28295 [Candidatus Angelobacter sp.]|nr:hypothetical protein [Candidatus Angelobacter sp.]